MIHPGFLINGVSAEVFVLQTPHSETEMLAQQLIRGWQKDALFTFYTSGSTTGEKHAISFLREQIIHSCCATAAALHLKEGMTSLLCMPLQYTGGRMMLYRAMVCGFQLNLQKPSSVVRPGSAVDFVALTPMQAAASCTFPEFLNIQKLIIGGASIGAALEDQLTAIPIEIHETFGMTETLSHVALRRVGRMDFFEALPGVVFSVNAQGCLIVCHALPKLPQLVTRDVVELISSTAFRWLGRIDHVINTGGIKVYPEAVERQLRPWIAVPFFVAGYPDEKLGAAVALYYESENEITEWPFDNLTNFEKPRYTIRCQVFRRTESGKIIRQQGVQTYSDSTFQ